MICYKQEKYSILFALGSVVLWFALFYTGSSFVHADSVQISNTISATANTGHNKAQDGEVIEGKGRASVFIETTRNGEVVEHVEESEEVQNGSVEIQVQTNTTDTSSTSSVSIRTDETQSKHGAEDTQHKNVEDSTAPTSQATNITSEHMASVATDTDATMPTTSRPLISNEEEATASTTIGYQSSSIVAHVVDFFESLVTYVTTLF